ncbi:hypothetical protein [Bdellovibrio sp. NC01]|uniref:hypothetical protein n=1 Tax=Bdellovibrio sp. NC01 TaxID=2220073 RepID=UPI001157F27B|nr:hypothetical protein [Bdellovibrio sp. NC01]QDK39166.1 hypothetical protein DOE51_17000 [Bdellovibrio sp. NC01]
MKQVPFKTLDAAIELVSTIDSDENMIKLTDGLFEGQPDLAQFLVDFAEDLNEEAQDLIVIMGLIIWRAMIATYGELRVMNEDEVAANYEAFEASMPDDENITEEWFVSLIKDVENFCQPEIFKYIIAELFQEAPEDSTLTDVENTQLTLGLRFFTEALNKLAQEKN